MAVQAQYPFSASALPSSTHVALGSFEELPLIQPVAANLLRIYNSVMGSNVPAQPVLDIGTLDQNENGLACNLLASRKRLREDEDLLARQQTSFVPLPDFQQRNPTTPLMISPSTAPVSTGLRLNFDDARIAPAATSTSGRRSSGHSLSSILKDEFQSQYLKQRQEIDELIKIQGERMKHALEEKRQGHTKALLALIEECVLMRLKQKQVEVEKICRRNLELEEQVKQLSLESQIWQNLAKNNEAMVSNLRSNLEQVVAQSREQSKEGCGESEADDAESCNYTASGDAHARTVKENRNLKEQRSCRVCRTTSACILLLPCRHLCLCKECDARRADCPLCGAPKNASVQVYMD